MVVLSKRVITNLLVKVVDMDLVYLEEMRGGLTAAFGYHIKLYDDIYKRFTKVSM